MTSPSPSTLALMFRTAPDISGTTQGSGSPRSMPACATLYVWRRECRLLCWVRSMGGTGRFVILVYYICGRRSTRDEAWPMCGERSDFPRLWGRSYTRGLKASVNQEPKGYSKSASFPVLGATLERAAVNR